jgi:uncharacterized membrane protein
MIYQSRKDELKRQHARGFLYVLYFILFLWLIPLFAVWVWSVLSGVGAVESALSLLGAPDVAALLREAFARRFAGIAGILTLLTVLGLSLSLLLRHTTGEAPRKPKTASPFIFLMVILAGLLVVGPEYLYLRDLFGTRMNTIFKFYYQAWILWGTVAAFGVAVVIREWKNAWGALVTGLSIFIILAGLAYPVMSVYQKTNEFNPGNGWRLDGVSLSPGDREAVEWLLEAPRGVLLEAVGGSYSQGGRISAHSGMPTVLGWAFHQGQWRGGYEEVGSRESDIERIYRIPTWDETESLLQLYDVRYIYIGAYEHNAYQVYEEKFNSRLPIVFENGEVVIYEFEQ